MNQSKISPDQFYDFLIEEDEPRACKAIPEEACTDVPKNFSLLVANGTLSKLAEKIISPNLSLSWMMDFFGAPASLVGALVPIKDGSSLIPQLFTSAKIRAYPKRKIFWVGSALTQALMWLIAAMLISFYEGELLPYLILITFIVFCLGSGVASVSFKDVIGKTVPKEVRGQMLSYRSTFGGALGLAAGLFLIFFIKEDASRSVYAAMFFLASLLWFLAAYLFSRVEENSGSTEGGRDIWTEFKKGYKKVSQDSNFSRFLVVRAMLMAIPLLQPYYVLIAKSEGKSSWKVLGAMIVISGLAQIISSPIWGKIADRSSPTLMRYASGLSFFGVLFSLAYLNFLKEYMNNLGFLLVFFINGVAYAGARLSRKTYLVDYAPEESRATYVSVANTSIGFFTILAASFGYIAQYFGLNYQLYFFSLMLLLSFSISFKLKEV